MNSYDLPTPAEVLPWHLEARCAQVDPDLWFPEPGASPSKQALNICMDCPVRLECLDNAMAEEGDKPASGRYGIFGGLTATERANLHHTIHGDTRTCPQCGVRFEPSSRKIRYCSDECRADRHRLYQLRRSGVAA